MTANRIAGIQPVEHPIEPVFDGNSRILILGSFPSVKSREVGFYYGHPQNRFWRVLAAVTGDPAPDTAAKKRAFLLRRGIALWDVIAKCEIEGSADARIRNAVPNDLSRIVSAAPVGAVFTNGKTADRLYDAFFSELPLPKLCLPSTSPANAAFSLERLIGVWGAALRPYLTKQQESFGSVT